MRYKTVIFDFDGTIAKSELATLETINVLAKEFSFAPIRSEEITALREENARDVLTRRLGTARWNMWKVYQMQRRGREEFEKRVAHVEVVEGIPDLIERLEGARVRVGIVSSNSDRTVTAILRSATIRPDFVRAGASIFGKSHALRKTIRQEHLDPSSTVYIGDEIRDVEACRAAGIDMIAVSWGFNSMNALSNTGVRVATDTDELWQLLNASE